MLTLELKCMCISIHISFINNFTQLYSHNFNTLPSKENKYERNNAVVSKQ